MTAPAATVCADRVPLFHQRKKNGKASELTLAVELFDAIPLT